MLPQAGPRLVFPTPILQQCHLFSEKSSAHLHGKTARYTPTKREAMQPLWRLQDRISLDTLAGEQVLPLVPVWLPHPKVAILRCLDAKTRLSFPSPLKERPAIAGEVSSRADRGSQHPRQYQARAPVLDSRRSAGKANRGNA